MTAVTKDTDTYTLRGHHELSLQAKEWRTVANSAAYLIPHLNPDLKLLDVGCGAGTIALDFAATYLPRGHVTGLEYSPQVVEWARANAAEHNVANVDFLAGDAHALPFPDHTFDITHAHQCLQHIPDPVLALREMHRVTKPGGIVAVRDSIASAFTWYPETPGLAEWAQLYRQVASANGGAPDAGSRLKAWAREAGFSPERISCTAGTWLFSTPEERAWWSDLWVERIDKSDFAKGAAKQGATPKDLSRLSQAWKEWASDEDGWFALLHGELIYRV